MAKQKKKKTELSKGMVKKPSINVQKLNPTQIKSVSNAKLLSSAKTSKVLREVKSRVKAGKIKLPKGFDTKRGKVSDLMNQLTVRKKAGR